MLLLSLFALVFSLRQIEKNSVDLKKLEEETKAKICAVHAKKVSIMGEIIVFIKVWRTRLITSM